VIRKIILSIVILLILGFTQSTQAFFVVDTGQIGPSPEVSSIIRMLDLTYSGQFTLATTYTVTDIEAYLINFDQQDQGQGPEELNMILTKGNKLDRNGLVAPDEVAQVHSEIFSIPLSRNFDWQGIHNLNLELNSGDYWVTLGHVKDNYLNVGAGFNSPNPLQNYAENGVNLAGYPNYPSSRNWGLRVNATPEPTTILLLGGGLVGALGLRRRKGHRERPE